MVAPNRLSFLPTPSVLIRCRWASLRVRGEEGGQRDFRARQEGVKNRTSYIARNTLARKWPHEEAVLANDGATNEVLLNDLLEDRRVAPAVPAPSGYTTAIGPSRHTRKQFAFVRSTPPDSESPSSQSRVFKNSHAASPRSFVQHFGSV